MKHGINVKTAEAGGNVIKHTNYNTYFVCMPPSQQTSLPRARTNIPIKEKRTTHSITNNIQTIIQNTITDKIFYI